MWSPDIFSIASKETAVNECKHNWVESNFAKKYRKPNEYMYHCTRCSQCRFAVLIGRSA